MAYVLSQYTGDALVAKLELIDKNKAKLDTIDDGANNYVLPQSTMGRLGGVVVSGISVNFPVNYAKVNINVSNGIIFVPMASASTHGALSSMDYAKLSKITANAENVINKIESVQVNGATQPIADKAVNIDLSGYVSSSSYEYTQVKHSSDWVTSFIMAAGNTEHPFLQGSLDDDGYAIGHMLDGYTYTKDCKIPLISDTQQGLVDSYCYENYIQPLLNGEYDDNISSLQKRIKALEDKIAKLENK